MILLGHYVPVVKETIPIHFETFEEPQQCYGALRLALNVFVYVRYLNVCISIYPLKNKIKWGCFGVQFLIQIGTNLCNSCHFKDRQGQVEIQLWQSRRDPPDSAVNGNQLFHSWDACSLVGETSWQRSHNNLWNRYYVYAHALLQKDVEAQYVDLFEQCSACVATFYSL